MNIVAILALIAKGISVAEALYAAGKEAGPALKVIKDLVTGAQNGNVTQAELDQTETLLDSLISDFNTDLPPA